MTGDLAWYDGPSLTTREDLQELSGKYRADSLIVSYALWLENRAYDDGLAALSAREQLVVSGAVFEREINAEGFQGFLGYYRVYLDTAKLCMRAIGKVDIETLICDADRAHLTDPDDSETLAGFDDAYHSYALDLADDLIALATG